MALAGRRALTASMAAGAGFAVFAFAQFRPTYYYGVLLAFAAVTAVICDWRFSLLSCSGPAGRGGAPPARTKPPNNGHLLA